MIPRGARLVFLKDGREILRDRRTLFVNLVLPVLLYPLLMMFLIQATQLARAHQAEPARLALIDAPEALADQVARAAKASGDPVQVEAPAEAARERLRLAAGALAGPGDPPAPKRAEGLAALRAANLAAAVVVLPAAAPASAPAARAVVRLVDGANPRSGEAERACEQALSRWKRSLVEERLRGAGLEAAALEPLTVVVPRLAPPSEELRTRVAGLVPMLLALLAVVGAFYPAVDLLAGERERGTLETLLVQPVRRSDIFLGKLLVVACAALVSVVLNLASLGLTAALAAGQIPASAGLDLGGILAMGAGSLALCLVVLLPLVVTVSAAALALSGLAASSKEAQNYLAPLILAVQGAAMVALVPHAAPTVALDLVPVTGAVVALKAALERPVPPWGHLLLATLASGAVAAVVVGWSARLMDDERFRYPALVRAGWGRFRRWGARPAAPGGLEVLAVYAVAVGGMTLGAGLMGGLPAPARVVAPLLAFIALPALLFAWVGAFRARETFFLAAPRPRQLAGAVALLPAALALSLGLGALQGLWMPPQGQGEVEKQIGEIIAAIERSGGLPLAILCLAVAPAVCEELLCRGVLLSGLSRGVGRVAAVLLTAFLFAVLHLSPYRLLPQCALGVLLAWMTLRTGSIVPAMVVHAGHNGLLVAAELLHARPAWAPLTTWVQGHASLAASGGALLALLGGWTGWRLLRAGDPPRPRE
jgi:sodium transport system permease protein